MLIEYIRAAMATAEFEPLEDEPLMFGHIPECRGVWATGATIEECREELQSVLEDWIVIKLHFGDEMPVAGGARLVTPRVVAVA